MASELGMAFRPNVNAKESLGWLWSLPHFLTSITFYIMLRTNYKLGNLSVSAFSQPHRPFIVLGCLLWFDLMIINMSVIYAFKVISESLLIFSDT